MHKDENGLDAQSGAATEEMGAQPDQPFPHASGGSPHIGVEGALDLEIVGFGRREAERARSHG